MDVDGGFPFGEFWNYWLFKVQVVIETFIRKKKKKDENWQISAAQFDVSLFVSSGFPRQHHKL